MKIFKLLFQSILACLSCNYFVQDSCLASEQYCIRETHRPRIGLALGGGGGRGSAHIGVLKIFEQEKIPIDYIAGTSAGSAIGGLYAAGVSTAELEKRAKNRSLLRAYYSMPVPLSLAYVPITLIPRLLGFHDYVGLYKGNGFARYLNSLLPANRKNIEETKIPFRAIATDILSGKAYQFDHGSLATAIQASSAIPWLKKPVEFEDKLLCDGVIAGGNLPVEQLRQMGADIVICVDIDGPLQPVGRAELCYSRSFRHRIANISLANIDSPAVGQADIVISPDVSSVPILSCKASDITKAIAAGEKAARQALPQISASLHPGRSARLSNK